MKSLCYQTLKEVGYSEYILEKGKEKVMQFGEGSFLRAFAGAWFDEANEKAGWQGKCVIIKPRNTSADVCRKLNEQEGLYTLYLRGLENGKKISRKRVISAVSRCLNPYEQKGFDQMLELAVSDDLEYVISNTTEAGIVYDPQCQLSDRPCSSFPGKLTQVLYARFRAEKGGLVILPCELIDNNGRELKKCVLQYGEQWKLGKNFAQYIQDQCLFCSTLVDRIVPGIMQEPLEIETHSRENEYKDQLMTIGELYGIWIIEGPAWLEEKLPFKKASLPCFVVPDVTPYKTRKVRILNGAHTGFALGGILAGMASVRDCMQNRIIRNFMNQMLYTEIIPILTMEKSELADFAHVVEDRFANPFIDHRLLSISLNSTSKWKTRNLPSLLEYMEQKGQLPTCLTMSFAAYLAFYTSNVQKLDESGMTCICKGDIPYICSDEKWVLEFYFSHRNDTPEQLVTAVLKSIRMWGRDLTEIPGFESAAAEALRLIREQGMETAFASCSKGGYYA